MTGEDAEDKMVGFEFVDTWSTSEEYPVLQWQE